MPRGGQAEDLAPQGGGPAPAVPLEDAGVVQQFAEGVDPPRRAVGFFGEDRPHGPVQLAARPADPFAIDAQHPLGVVQVLPVLLLGEPVGQDAAALEVPLGDGEFFGQHSAEMPIAACADQVDILMSQLYALMYEDDNPGE